MHFKYFFIHFYFSLQLKILREFSRLSIIATKSPPRLSGIVASRDELFPLECKNPPSEESRQEFWIQIESTCLNNDEWDIPFETK